MRFKLSCRASLICFCGVALTWAAHEETDQSGLIEQVKHHYSDWDSNHDHKLSANEVARALTNPTRKKEEVAALTWLQRDMHDNHIKTLTLKQITASLSLNPKTPK